MQLPPYRWRFAHLAALWAYGVSQPVFSMLKSNPEFLVVRGSTRADVAVFAVLLVLLPPLAVTAAEAVISAVSRTLSRTLHIVALWGFAYLAVLQLVRLLDPERGAALLLPMLPAGLVALAYVKWPVVRSFLSVSLALPALALVSFVATVPLAIDDAPVADIRIASPVPVVVVVFDEFPVSSIMRADGSLDTVRYPGFARLARDATWYPRATAVHESTTSAVPAILTGQRPQPGVLPTLEDHPDNLFTLLGSGYAVHADEQVTRLCPSSLCPRTRGQVPLLDRERGLFYDVSVGYLHRVLPSSLARGLPPIGERWGGFGNNETTDARELVLGALDGNAWLAALAHAKTQRPTQFADFLASLDRGKTGRPSLFFEHALLPHSPWAFLPSGDRYGDAERIEGIKDDWSQWGPSSLLVQQALQRHLFQVGYVDRLVGALVTALKRAGIYDRALVVVTADHGVSFKVGGYPRPVTPQNLPDIAGVPLFVKYPKQRLGTVDRRDAKTIDVLPTIAEVVGVAMPWHVDGVSLRRAPATRPVSIGGADGGPIVGEPDVIHAGVLATARRNARLFGDGSDSLFRLGPFGTLRGRKVEALAPSSGGSTVVRLDDPKSFADVRKSSGFVPARIVGEITGGSVSAGTPLAVAVNGRIEAMTRSFEDHARSSFAVLVPEAAFHDGRNPVDVFAVARSGGRLILTRLGGTAPAGGRVVATSTHGTPRNARSH